ncbi:cystathionine gamma-synthase TDEL_0E05710 [Torulaspora delbrueckii]|uniref:Cystathionine gamma-synthase n=1 Tax=Torulaspora delbrueckii TaxID=4950 RepID=G8ZW20_TORDE|nr:hypothetical protein TDEL_0E05710 [Torulaspora delbrueckii]CCE92814.1 hypothetical protein TDEL_0E05710 [Torulaspora delbrueckii]
MTEIEFGKPLPSNLDYAVSFGIPTWDSAIGYVEKNPDVISKMDTGYPRYFPQPPIQKLCNHFIKKFGCDSESCRPFPSYNLAKKCLEFVKSIPGSTAHLEVETFQLVADGKSPKQRLVVTIAAVLASGDDFDVVREYWKLRGECVSSRLAESLHQLLTAPDSRRQEAEAKFFLANEEGNHAKKLIKQRIVDNHCNPFGSNSNGEELVLNPDTDAYLVSSGMSSIFTARDILSFWEEKRASKHSLGKKSQLCKTAAVFGFPFKDTKVIMEKFGHCQFFGVGDSKDVAELKKYLDTSDHRILAAFVETPSNPLLNMPDLTGLRKLANEYGFFIVIDDTIGGLNVDILPYADIVCTSLTKLFNGSSNVMGGSLILNPKSSLYSSARAFVESDGFEDLLWCEDAKVLEINSRDFEDRTVRANKNTERLLSELILVNEGKVFKKIYYPTVSSEETFKNYEAVRNKLGGYGCMFSMAFYSEEDSKAFYDSLKVFKGPSNGTNFTLACPYVQLAHRFELEEVSKFGADPNLIRVSVGLEDSQWLLDVFSDAINMLERRRSQDD